MMKSTSSSKTSKTATPSARRKLALKKEAIADLAPGRKSAAVKAGGYSYTCGGRSIIK